MLCNNLDCKFAGSLFLLLAMVFTIMFFLLESLHSRAISQAVQPLVQIAASFDSGGSESLNAFIDRLQDLPNTAQATGNMLRALIIAGTGFIIMAVMGVVFRYLLLQPIKSIDRSLRQASKDGEKNLTLRLHFKRQDEVGYLAQSFNTFISSLDTIIKHIGSKTETVAASSSQVFVVAEQMAEKSADLYERSSSVAAAAEEMNVSMHTVAAASEEASTNIAMVAETASQFQSNIAGVAAHCQEAGLISSDAGVLVEAVSEKVDLLGLAAEEIGNVTEIITEIAEKTNLLALNATIEAARAGVAGKGFAVVAEEIKGLAGQTAEATQNIRNKIETIQVSTRDAVAEASNISAVMTQVDGIVKEIALSVDEQARAAIEVAENIEQASIGIGEVNENVAQSSMVAEDIAREITKVDGVAADIATGSQNMTAGAQDLDQLSLDLRKMIAAFRVSQTETRVGVKKELPASNIPDLMPWSTKLATSIKSIDLQHKELVRLVNLLHKAMRLQKGSTEVGSILNQLAEYTVMHFAFEEKYFDKYAYTDTTKHKAIHKKLVSQVVDIQKDFESGKATVTMDLMDFLKDWLYTHIMKTDMAYATFLQSNMTPEEQTQG